MNAIARPSFTVVTGKDLALTTENEVATLRVIGELRARYQHIPKGSSNDVGKSCCWHLEIVNQFKCTLIFFSYFD